MCPLCHHEQQTLSHLLVTCIKTASFWQTFQVWWYRKTGENLLLNQGKILHGFFENTAHWQALNYLIILAKYHIFCTNGHEDEICFQSFLLRVKEKITILKDVRANCFCASLLRTQIHKPRHPLARALTDKMNK